VETGDNQAMAIGMEFLNTVILSNMSPHRLALKVGVRIILLRNLDATLGFCNGTRVNNWRPEWRLIIVHIIGGTHAGNIVNIPRITTATNSSKSPFIVQRRQFRLQLAFTMTINKAQGKTIKIVDIYLPELVFTHGLLYVTLSQAMRVNDIYVFCSNGRMTTNVDYTELLR
jgi:ATP-dependent DNA helicase PIF1